MHATTPRSLLPRRELYATPGREAGLKLPSQEALEGSGQVIRPY